MSKFKNKYLYFEIPFNNTDYECIIKVLSIGTIGDADKTVTKYDIIWARDKTNDGFLMNPLISRYLRQRTFSPDDFLSQRSVIIHLFYYGARK